MFIVIINHKITTFIDHTSQAHHFQQQVPPIRFRHNPPLMSARPIFAPHTVHDRK